MKPILTILGVVVALIVIVLVIGAMLPKEHTARVRTVLHAPPESVYAAITDVEHAPAWRTGLKKVEVLERDPLRWRETAEWGTLTFVHDNAVPPSRVVARIADESQGFGGTWTYEIAPAPDGSAVTITENGTVSNPLFRFLTKFVLGHYSSLETYARDLAKRSGDTSEPERIN